MKIEAIGSLALDVLTGGPSADGDAEVDKILNNNVSMEFIDKISLEKTMSNFS